MSQYRQALLDINLFSGKDYNKAKGECGLNLGERIQELREKKGITRYRLTQITGISGHHIKGIEEGTRQPTIDTLEKLIVPLGVTLAELFNDGDVTYLSEKEKQLIENFRALSGEKIEALLLMSEVLKK